MRLKITRRGRDGSRRLIGPMVIVGLAMVAFTFLSFTGKAPAQDMPVSTSPSDLQAGQTLFAEHCSSCHGAGGVGTEKAPELYNVGAAAVDFYLATGRMPLDYQSAQALRHSPYFNETQINQIVAYVSSLGDKTGTPGPGIPQVEPLCSEKVTTNCTTMSEGQQLFVLNCAPCHDTSGAGGMLSRGFVVPSLDQATSKQVAEAIRIGPQPMPKFGPGQLNEKQMSAVVNYVQYLRHPDDKGGLGISHFGPVAEGFVGIVFGLGLMMFVSRMIGNRG